MAEESHIPVTELLTWEAELPDPGAIDEYCRLIQEEWAGEELQRLAHRLQSDAPVAERTAAAEAALSAIATAATQGKGPAPAADWISDYVTRLEEGFEGFAYPTGFADLDAMLIGLVPANMVTLAARPGMGKTVFAMNVAENLAKNGHPVVVFELEMSANELAARAVSGASGVGLKILLDHKLYDEHWKRIIPAAHQ